MNKVYTIGRDPSCDIIINDPSDVVSRVHATLKVKGRGIYILVDQGRNGTYVNGMRMSPNEEIPVSRKDVISFAHIADLDWEQIPKESSKGLLWGGLACVAAAAVGVTLYCVLKPGADTEGPTPPAPEPEKEVIHETIVRNDTIRDTVIVKKEVPAPQPKKDTKTKGKDKNQKPQPDSTAVEPIYDSLI